MHNQRGGILSKLFIIPIGVALMVGFFFLGYYVGKYQNKSGTANEALPALPDIVAKNLPSKEEFTFYKTLTDKNDKTVSIDLKPKTGSEENKTEKKPAVAETPKTKTVPAPPKEKQMEINIEKEPAAKQQKPAPAKQPQVQAKKEPAPQAPSDPKVRYTLQLASYPEKEAADGDVKKMKQRGYAAFIVAADVPGKGTWYRVRLGSFSNKNAAEKLQKQINAKEGLSPIIVME
jgi:cell division septation protein DedD